MKGAKFDIFFEPLLEELKMLWFEGLVMENIALFFRQHQFTCRLVILCTTDDLLDFGIVAGCNTKGYLGCPHCGPMIISRYS